MSLLDDVSIVVTPNGYKAGELYAVIPVPTEGAEEITNGDFATDSDWSKATGVTISGGNAIFNNSTANNNGIFQAAVFTANTQYKITAEVSNYSSGNVTAWSGGSQNINSNESFTGNGTKTWIISTGASNGYFLLSSATTNGNFNIDNVSVKEYTAADMDVTRATAATRVDENGLVNYAEVLGSELAICGDFECASPLTGWTVNSDGAISIDSGKLKVLNVTNRGRSYRTYTGLTIGKTYEAFVGNISGDVGGYCHITSGTANNNITLNATFFFVAGATTADFQCGVNSTVVDRFTFFDNISLKQNDRDNVPRIDYTGGGCPHILAEPQRTNLVTYSVDIDSYFTSQVDVTFTNDYETSPTGDNNSTRVQWADSTSFAYRAVSISTDTSASIFVKGTSGETVMFGFGANVTTGTVYTFDGSWQRITFTGSTGTTIFLSSYGGSTATDFQAFGLQLEVGSYSTSYIPTSGSTVTRNQDIFTRDGIGSLINSTEGVLFVEMAAFPNDTSGRWLSLSNGTVNERLSYGFQSSNIRVYISNTSGLIWDYTTSGIDILNYNKIALKYKSGDYALWINGTEVSTSTDSNLPSSLNSLQFDSGAGSSNFDGKVKQLQVYDTSLSDDQLLQLTGESGTDFYESYAEMASALTYTIQ